MTVAQFQSQKAWANIKLLFLTSTKIEKCVSVYVVSCVHAGIAQVCVHAIACMRMFVGMPFIYN